MGENHKQNKAVYTAYSEGFKRQVIEEYLRTGTSKMSIQRKYNIVFKSAICTWMKKLGYEDIHQKSVYFEDTNQKGLKKKYAAQEPVGQTDDIASLKKKVEELKHELENERLRSEAYKLTIEIAEKEFNIPIRKKANTK